jgi:hypothetical protein
MRGYDFDQRIGDAEFRPRKSFQRHAPLGNKSVQRFRNEKSRRHLFNIAPRRQGKRPVDPIDKCRLRPVPLLHRKRQLFVKVLDECDGRLALRGHVHMCFVRGLRRGWREMIEDRRRIADFQRPWDIKEVNTVE